MAVSTLIVGAFHLARSRYPAENRLWIDLSARLAGRTGVTPMMISTQRAGEIDLVLRSMEDEFDINSTGQDPFVFNYQVMLSETWVLACYENLRTVRQRDGEAAKLAIKRGSKPESDAISGLEDFKTVFEELELLRMPIAKFELAKDKEMKAPITLQSVGDGAPSKTVYDRADPSRLHIMPTGVSAAGRIGWQTLDHRESKQFWIERRNLSDRLLALVEQIEPAGLREARIVADAAPREQS